jgi:hypothetical protein
LTHCRKKKVLDYPEDSSTTYTPIFSLPALFVYHYQAAVWHLATGRKLWSPKTQIGLRRLRSFEDETRVVNELYTYINKISNSIFLHEYKLTIAPFTLSYVRYSMKRLSLIFLRRIFNLCVFLQRLIYICSYDSLYYHWFLNTFFYCMNIWIFKEATRAELNGPITFRTMPFHQLTVSFFQNVVILFS